MQLLEVSCAVRPIYGSLGAKGLNVKKKGEEEVKEKEEKAEILFLA
jgi:hypothetical protein